MEWGYKTKDVKVCDLEYDFIKIWGTRVLNKGYEGGQILDTRGMILMHEDIDSYHTPKIDFLKILYGALLSGKQTRCATTSDWFVDKDWKSSCMVFMYS